MLKVKDTLRATVHLTYRRTGDQGLPRPRCAMERFDQRSAHSAISCESRGCGFIPQLIEADPEKIRIIDLELRLASRASLMPGSR